MRPSSDRNASRPSSPSASPATANLVHASHPAHATHVASAPNASKMKTQVVAGFVIYRRTTEGVKYLLLYRRGNYWNFPKGHFEPGENSLETAFRETEEETGIKKSELRIIPNFRAQTRFVFQRGSEKIHDTVILYLAETKKASVVISPREHSGFAWFLYQDVIKILGSKYQGTKNVLKQANDFIRRQSHPRRPGNPARPHAKLLPGGRESR